MEIKMETSRLINRDARICIIGAGMAGLTAANYLMARYWADSDLTVIYSYSDTPMDVKAVQGTRRTYYGGGLLNFELVENVTAWSKYLVDTWFS
jgi:ribulose 1,5-bisphosphate synthetase/thiazole synthase